MFLFGPKGKPGNTKHLKLKGWVREIILASTLLVCCIKMEKGLKKMMLKQQNGSPFLQNKGIGTRKKR